MHQHTVTCRTVNHRKALSKGIQAELSDRHACQSHPRNKLGTAKNIALSDIIDNHTPNVEFVGLERIGKEDDNCNRAEC